MITHCVTKETILPQEDRYEEVTYHWGRVHGTPPTIVQSKLHTFSIKEEGSTYIDGQYFGDWIKYT